MIDIVPHIQYLVGRHDCVTLPGWGAFVSRHEPAVIAGAMMMPPRRVVGFNADICHDDGMIAASVARREGIAYDSARSRVAAAIASMRETFALAGILIIPRVGTLCRNSEGLTEFVPAPGAESVAGGVLRVLPPLELAAEEQHTVVAAHSPAAGWVVPFLRKSAGVAAAVAMLLGLGVVLSTPINVERSGLSYASVSAPAVSAARPAVIAPALPADTRLLVFEPDAAEATATVTPPAPAPVAVAKPSKKAPEYYLIVSSHANADEARRYIAARPGAGLGLLVWGGRFRVYAAKGNDPQEVKALTKDPAFAAANPDAWVYRK